MVRHGFEPGNSTSRIQTSVLYQPALAMIGAHAQGFRSSADSQPYVPTGTHSHLKFESSEI